MTGPLSGVLHDIAHDADVGRLPTPEVLRAHGDRRRRRAAVGLVVTVTVAASLVALVLAAGRPSDRSPEPVRPLPSPPVIPGPDDVERGPTRHQVATGSQRFSAHAIAVLDGRYVVVGDSSDIEDPGPAVYWSDDGVDWHAPASADAPTSANVTDVVATSDGLLAVGVGRRGTAAAWRSADGRAWVESPVISPTTTGSSLWGVTETGSGFFAWGFVESTAHVWRSDDGAAWVPVADQSVFDLPQSETVCAVRDVGGGLEATGVEAPAGTRTGHAVTWSSTDGESWTLTRPAGPGTTWCDPPSELGHWEARGAAGVVRVDPYGATGNEVELVPDAP